MSINDLPAIMGTVLIVVGLALVVVSTWSRAEGSEKTTQAGALIIVVGAFLLGLSIFVSHVKKNRTQVRAPFKLGHYPARLSTHDLSHKADRLRASREQSPD